MEHFCQPAWASRLAVLPPSSCPLAECGGLEKILDFIATAKNITVLLILHPKHSSHWEES